MKQWKLKAKNRMEQQAPSKMNTIIVMVSMVVIVFGLFGIMAFLNKDQSRPETAEQIKTETSENNVSMKDGKQVIEILAKGGYSPKQSIAKAGVPTVLKFITKGTYDCSSAMRIPSLDISKNLPGSGETEIEIGPQGVGKLAGTCSMGMYFFEIDFQA